MKKALLLILFLSLGSTSWAFWGSSSSVDYSKDANSSYYCGNPSGSAVTTQAGVSVSSPTLSLYNPPNSGKNLVLLDVGIGVTASPAAAASFFLAYNISVSSGINQAGFTVTTPIMTSALVGKSTSTATTTSIATCKIQGVLPATPIAFRYLGGTTGASAIGGVVFTDTTQGKVVIPPGAIISIQSTSAAALVADFLWREDPI